ncbi:MAG: hypothetical protein HQM10_25610 [Candidatus Riflebacteria bacterium]|nr:hypothetical protein [Candidatus Riflebacteria bacterium]
MAEKKGSSIFDFIENLAKTAAKADEYAEYIVNTALGKKSSSKEKGKNSPKSESLLQNLSNKAVKADEVSIGSIKRVKNFTVGTIQRIGSAGIGAIKKITGVFSFNSSKKNDVAKDTSPDKQKEQPKKENTSVQTKPSISSSQPVSSKNVVSADSEASRTINGSSQQLHDKIVESVQKVAQNSNAELEKKINILDEKIQKVISLEKDVRRIQESSEKLTVNQKIETEPLPSEKKEEPVVETVVGKTDVLQINDSASSEYFEEKTVEVKPVEEKAAEEKSVEEQPGENSHCEPDNSVVQKTADQVLPAMTEPENKPENKSSENDHSPKVPDAVNTKKNRTPEEIIPKEDEKPSEAVKNNDAPFIIVDKEPVFKIRDMEETHKIDQKSSEAMPKPHRVAEKSEPVLHDPVKELEDKLRRVDFKNNAEKFTFIQAISDLKDDNNDIKSQAAEKLGALGKTEAVPYLIQALIDNQDGTSELLEVLSDTIVKLKSVDSCDKLISAIEKVPVRNKLIILNILAHFDSELVEKTIISCICDEDKDIQRRAISIASWKLPEAALPTIIKVYFETGNLLVERSCIEAFTSFEQKLLINEFIFRLQSEDETDKVKADKALHHLTGKNFGMSSATTLSERENVVRLWLKWWEAEGIESAENAGKH